MPGLGGSWDFGNAVIQGLALSANLFSVKTLFHAKRVFPDPQK